MGPIPTGVTGAGPRPAAGMDRLQDAHRDEVGHHRRAADRHERERDPRHGRDAHRHPDVDEHLEEEREDDPSRHDRTVEVSRDGDHPEAAPHHEQVEEQQDCGAEEAALLGERREHEVGCVLRQIVEARLARLDDTTAVDPAGADRRDRLVDVVRQPAGIRVGIREPGQTRRLVRLEDLDPGRGQEPEDAEHQHGREPAEERQMQPANTRDEQHRGERGRVDEGRAEVGLEEDEEHRGRAERDRVRHGPHASELALTLDEEARDREHEEHLAELGRLELDRPQLDPALRAADRLREGENEDHAADREHVDDAPVTAIQRGVIAVATTSPTPPIAAAVACRTR